MSYSIEPDEAPGPAARRIAGEQVAKALHEIRDIDRPVDWRVHQLRKRCKNVRALARLIRPGFEHYKEVNATFRDFARRVSDHRDARVMADLVEDLVGDDSVPHAAMRWYRTRCDLAEEHATAVLAELEESLAAAAVEIERWQVANITFDDVAGGLAMTLGRAEACYREVGPGASSGAFHQWRKRCKYHRLHLDLLEELLPESDNDRYARFKKTDTLIGDEHDCAVLVDHVTSQPAYIRERVEVRELLVAAMQRRRQLRRKALRHADGLFTESAAHFADRIGDYWRRTSEAAAG